LKKNKKEVFTMARIKIKDLPKDMKISREEMKKLFGGAISLNHPYLHTGYYLGSDPYVINDPHQSIDSIYLSERFGSISEWGERKK